MFTEKLHSTIFHCLYKWDVNPLLRVLFNVFRFIYWHVTLKIPHSLVYSYTSFIHTKLPKCSLIISINHNPSSWSFLSHRKLKVKSKTFKTIVLKWLECSTKKIKMFDKLLPMVLTLLHHIKKRTKKHQKIYFRLCDKILYSVICYTYDI